MPDSISCLRLLLSGLNCARQFLHCHFAVKVVSVDRYWLITDFLFGLARYFSH